jgi:hypothetical protein
MDVPDYTCLDCCAEWDEKSKQYTCLCCSYDSRVRQVCGTSNLNECEKD